MKITENLNQNQRIVSKYQLSEMTIYFGKALVLRLCLNDVIISLRFWFNTGNPQAVKILLDNGANPNTYYESKLFNQNKSALYAAFSRSMFRILFNCE